MTTPDNTQRGYAAIGKVCAFWSDLEWWCQRVCEVTAPFLAVDFERSEVEFVLTIALAHMDGRNRVATAKVLVEQSGISAATKKRAIAALNRIDNELRPERNRYVHDEWIVSEHRAARTTLRPKVTKPQAKKSGRITFETKIFSNEELERFADALGNEISEMLSICEAIRLEYEAAAPALRSSQQAREAKAG